MGFLLPVPSPAGAQKAVAAFTSLAPGDAYRFIQENKGNSGFMLLDVRTPEEFEEGHIEGAVNINYNGGDFVEELKALNRDKTYLIYCRTGRRSSDTLTIMKRLEFKKVFRIEGDIVRWKAEKLPVVKGKK
jgi:rhodanese-related sulfurtransferase